MTKEIIIIIIAASLIFDIVFFTIYFRYARKKKETIALKNLSQVLNGSISKTIFLPSFNGEYQGLKFSILSAYASENSVPCLSVSLFKKSLFDLKIRRESVLTDLGKKAGLIHEIKIDDEAFDKELLAVSNKQDKAMIYLANKSIRQAIRELFFLGFNILSISGKRIMIQKPNYNVDIDLAPQRVIDVLQKLILAANGL